MDDIWKLPAKISKGFASQQINDKNKTKCRQTCSCSIMFNYYSTVVKEKQNTHDKTSTDVKVDHVM